MKVREKALDPAQSQGRQQTMVRGPADQVRRRIHVHRYLDRL
jgi:hypothetical protein